LQANANFSCARSNHANAGRGEKQFLQARTRILPLVKVQREAIAKQLEKSSARPGFSERTHPKNHGRSQTNTKIDGKPLQTIVVQLRESDQRGLPKNAHAPKGSSERAGVPIHVALRPTDWNGPAT
jgi:hypothetical protein